MRVWQWKVESQSADAHTFSGISVQNPDRAGAPPGGDLVRDLLRRAAEYVYRFIYYMYGRWLIVWS